MADPQPIGNIIGKFSTSREDMQALLDGLRADNGSGIETAATGS